MTSQYLSLGPVLDLIERWQQAGRLLDGHADLPVLTFDEIQVNNRALYEVDILTLRKLAEQHAAQLRKLAFMNRNSGDDVNPEPPMVSWDELNEIADAFDAAADFLCAPRREPEAE